MSAHFTAGWIGAAISVHFTADAHTVHMFGASGPISVHTHPPQCSCIAAWHPERPASTAGGPGWVSRAASGDVVTLALQRCPVRAAAPPC